ncbi:hypothetical protein DRW41_11255 [Neobacillus piezotolerans]|uniref:Uncharacterized protein n=1 Tax=Neobacillus piezotolerans TaxID=2259171 RepID=A0A3D8GQS6_9BACI|nr:hypothetical protein DRW41_11255 [Neobacillus piezotolerans]
MCFEAEKAENLDNLPGVDVSNDWKRGRTYGETHHSAADIISHRVFRVYFDINKKGQPTTK